MRSDDASTSIGRAPASPGADSSPNPVERPSVARPSDLAQQETRQSKRSRFRLPSRRADAAPSTEMAPAADASRPARIARPTDEIAEVTFDEACALRDEDRRDLRMKMIAVGVALAVLFFASLCVSNTLGGGFNNPIDVLEAVWLHIAWGVGALFGQPGTMSYADILSQYPVYYEVETRFAVSLMTVVCGVLLALSGSLYQMVFRNPIAAPTMLGVANGISLGTLVLVLQFGVAALDMEIERHLYSYIGAVAVLGLVLGITRAICGKGKAFSVLELLLVGSIFSQVAGSIVGAVSDVYLSEEMWEVYSALNEATRSTVSVMSVLSIVFAVLVGLVPVFLMRYSINAMNYSEEESKLIGLDTTRLKLVCLVCGTIMVVVAQVNLGTVSMVSLVVPFISRALFGTEFKRQFWGDVLLGAFLLLLCRDIVVLVPLFHMEMSLGTVVSFITLPLYVWIVASRQRGWK